MEAQRNRNNHWRDLVLAALWGLNLWMAVQDYQKVSQLTHVYSPEAMEQMLSAITLKGGTYAILVLTCVLRFLTGMLLRPGRAMYLADGLRNLLIGVLDCALLAVVRPTTDEPWLLVFWLLIAALLLGAGVYDLWKFKKCVNNTSNIGGTDHE